MSRRNRKAIDSEAARKTVVSHMIVVSMLMLAAFFRIAYESGDDWNVTMFSMVIASPFIFIFSMTNTFIIGLLNDVNERWSIANYCAPAIIVLLIGTISRFHWNTVDIIIFPSTILLADLALYALENQSGTAEKQQQH